MAGVITKFVTASLFMWIAPVAILYGYNHNLIPGKTLVSNTAAFSFLLLLYDDILLVVGN